MSDRPLDILVIGGSGFVSGALARRALDAGHAVWALTRGERAIPEGATPLTADRHDTAAFEQAVRAAGRRWDLVVDCIAYEVEDAEQDIAAFRERTEHLVFISTDFVFDPDSRRKFPLDETHPHFLEDAYGGKKRRCECALRDGDTGEMAWTILRPCHIYGPGSKLGCLPAHGRDPDLIKRMKAGESLKLVGGGHFLQQPIFARDLAEVILGCAGNPKTYGETYLTAGPDVIESREYYRIVGDLLSLSTRIEEIPVEAYRAEHPDKRSFLCHRVYNMAKLQAHGLPVPSTPIEDGLREHVASLSA